MKKKIKNRQPQTKFTGSYKKKSVTRTVISIIHVKDKDERCSEKQNLIINYELFQNKSIKNNSPTLKLLFEQHF